MEYLKICAFLIFFLLVSCGVKLDKTIGGQEQKVDSLLGSITLVDGTTLDLTQEKQPFVLIFAGYTCQTCKEEAKEFAKHFAQKGGLPKEIKIITVLAQSSIERAKKWQQQNNVKWVMGYDQSGDYFKALCPELITPCVYGQNLRTRTPMHKYKESPKLENLEKETGPWTY